MEWEIIQLLLVSSISLFCWALKDNLNRVRDNIKRINMQTDQLWAEIGRVKENYPSKQTIDYMLKDIEKQILALEKNISEKIDLHMKVMDSRLKPRD